MDVSIAANGIINFSNIKMWGYLNTGGVYRTGTAPVVYEVYGIK